MMEEKRNIDQLFQERFKGFEADPSPEVWDKIKAKLQEEKDDRKIIPIWWKLGGVAALLALLLSVGSLFYNASEENQLVIEDTTEMSDDNFNDPTNDLTSPKSDKGIVEGDNSKKVDGLDPDSEEISGTQNPLKEAISSSNSDVETLTNKKKGKTYKEPLNYQEEKVAVSEKTTLKTDKSKFINPVIDEKTETKLQKEAIAKTNSNLEESKNNIDGRLNQGQEKALPNNGLNPKVLDKEKAVAQVEAKTTEEEISQNNKKSIFDAIEESEEALATEENEPRDGSWEIAPNVGPVYYNSLSGGSSIDPSFSDNSQEGNVNLSYGVQVAYNINDKLSIRSGINNINVGYNTGEVEIISGPQTFALKSVQYRNPQGREQLSVLDRGTIMSADGANNPYEQLNLKSSSPSAELTQNISYFEIPLELKYNLLNKKFGINMIGGFSTLLLGNNEIVVNDGEFRSVLGEANNLNTVSFSTNIGFGLNYQISKRLRFNVEPMFKYQLNPYSDTSVNFRPYYLGVYSGFSLKF